MSWEIKANEIASAIYAGFANKDWLGKLGDAIVNFTKFLKPVGDFLSNVAKNVTNFVGDVWRGFQQFFNNPSNFLSGWFEDDPVAATAGTAAVLLTAGILIVTGGGIIGAIGKFALGSWLKLGIGGKIGSIIAAIGLGGLIRMAIGGVSFLWNFNWQVTDKQIETQQKAIMSNIWGVAGAALGSAIGTLLCGTAPVELLKSGLIKVNPSILAKIKLAEEELFKFDPAQGQYGELYDEMIENFKALLQVTGRSISQIIFLETYKNLRKIIKAVSRGIGLTQIPGIGPLIDKWGEEGSKSWSFAAAIEEAIESIEDGNIQNFTEELYESFTEACGESLMIISYSV